MPFILKRDDRFSWPVSFDVPIDGGKFKRETFDAEFRRLSQSRLDEIRELSRTEGVTDPEVAREVLVGWSGIKDDDGEDVPFSESALEQLLDVPMLATAIVAKYFESLQGAKAKN
jgi:hypothetical protein